MTSHSPDLPPVEEANPFLGLRGVRYTAAYPELLRTQLRALLSASTAGRLSIMIPMVSDLAEIEEVRQVMTEAQAEVGGEAELGIMIEVPATAVDAEHFARHVEFFSVGTNDLTQYTLAVDRGNETVAHLYRSFHPAVLRLLQLTVDGAHAHGRWAGVCGEMAGDRAAIPILIGLGFDELSMTPSRIPAARELIRSLDFAACRELAEGALLCETAAEVENLVRKELSGGPGKDQPLAVRRRYRDAVPSPADSPIPLCTSFVSASIASSASVPSASSCDPSARVYPRCENRHDALGVDRPGRRVDRG